MDDFFEQLDASIKRTLDFEEKAWRQGLTVENLTNKMLDTELDIIMRERAAIGRYMLTHGVDFEIIKAVVGGKHWVAIHPWNDEDGNLVFEKMMENRTKKAEEK